MPYLHRKMTAEGVIAQLARAPALQAGVKTASVSLQGDFPMRTMFAIAKSRGRAGVTPGSTNVLYNQDDS